MSDHGTRRQERRVEDTGSHAEPSEQPQPGGDTLGEATAALDAGRVDEAVDRLATHTAKAEMSPVGSAARTAYLAIAANIGTTALSLETVVTELGEQVEGVALDRDLRRGKAALAAQADTLNLLYNLLAQRGIAASLRGEAEQGGVLLKFALRAQAQCRATWETLHMMGNPPAARQTNIALNQQVVNNGRGALASDSPTRNPQGKLLEQTNHEPDEWLERNAPPAATKGNSTMEAVETSDGTAHGSGQSDRRA